MNNTHVRDLFLAVLAAVLITGGIFWYLNKNVGLNDLEKSIPDFTIDQTTSAELKMVDLPSDEEVRVSVVELEAPELEPVEPKNLTKAVSETEQIDTTQAPTHILNSNELKPLEPASLIGPSSFSFVDISYPQFKVGDTITITYKLDSTVDSSDPVIVNAGVRRKSDAFIFGAEQAAWRSAGTYSFDWTPKEPGTYRAHVSIDHPPTGIFKKVSPDIVVIQQVIEPEIIEFFGQEADTTHMLTWRTENTDNCYLTFNDSTKQHSTKTNALQMHFQSRNEATAVRLHCVSAGGQSVTSEEVILEPLLNCDLSSPTIYYDFQENFTISWDTSGAERAYFVPDTSGGDNIIVPTGDQALSGSIELFTNVYGQPTVDMEVVSSEGKKRTCRIRLQVSDPR